MFSAKQEGEKMVRMVRVIVEGGNEGGGEEECLARRLLPIPVEHGLTMVMALEDSCMACGLSCFACGESCLACEDCCEASEASNKDDRMCPDSSTFLRNLESLRKEERHACLRVTGSEIMTSLAQIVSCVGCRRSVENLHQNLQQSGGAALQPLAISQDGEVFVPKDHMATPDALARLFVPQALRLSSTLFGSQGGQGGKGRGKRGGSSRCPQHNLGMTKGLGSTWNWEETWECMESECREAVVLLPNPVLRQTIDKYLTKHRFCSDCAFMVNRAYALLVEKGKEPAVAAGEKPKDACPNWNLDGSFNLYSVISACTKEGHVHVQCNRHYVSHLITLAEPHLSGLKQERHAKSIWVAQNEVLICIGIALYERFHNIQQKISEGERTCDLLLLACLNSLRCSLDVAAESKRGEAYIDQLCLELDGDGEAKKGKKKRKKERKTKEMSEEPVGEKRENCRECRSSVESCADEEEENKVTCSFGIAVENQRKEAFVDQVCLELEDEGDTKKDTKKEKKKKKKQEQRNRKHSSDSDDKSGENRSSVESTTLSDEESSAANEASLDIVREKSEDEVNEVRRMTKAEKKSAKKKKNKQQANDTNEKKTSLDEGATVEDCDSISEKDENDDNDSGCGLDVAVDNNTEEISLDFEDMDGHWEEAKKGKKNKKKQEEKRKQQQMEDYGGNGGKMCMYIKNTTSTPASFDEVGQVDDENKENSFVNGKLEKRTVCHKGQRKEVLLETRDPRPRARPITLVSAFSTNKCSRPIRSLADMLEEEEKDVEQIPDEVIIRFLLSADETAKRRKELRENLRRRFADFCNCHHTRNCPAKSF